MLMGDYSNMAFWFGRPKWRHDQKSSLAYQLALSGRSRNWGGATEPQTPMCFSPAISTLYSVYLAYSATCSGVVLQPCFVEDLHGELGDLDDV
jgi:hypothetical protein